MPDDKIRPYAAVGNVLDVLDRYRNRNLPEVLDLAAMRTAGVPEGMVGRTLAALRFLGLLTEANEPTAEWRALTDVSPDVFPQLLAGLVRAAYADVFALVDPSTDGQERIRSAFQQFQPKSQIDRMVSLFLALCNEAGIPTKDAPKRRPTKAQQLDDAKKPPRSVIVVGKPAKATAVAHPATVLIRPGPAASGESKTISLRGGGQLTLHVTTTFFALPKDDREFVFELLDKLSSYENQRLLSAPAGHEGDA